MVIGAARSGKSRFAQSLCSAPRVAYIATARAEDDEMRRRIARHQQDRPPHWLTIEEPLDLAGAVLQAASQADVIIVDCLTLWLSNLMWAQSDHPLEEVEFSAKSQIDQIAELACRHEV
ncbi:MAG TPA: bifunctional adenosylcobinamide kinase/adenosylcobinamide-phosphate guanylyltransferase, partial [Bryobacteraceae bacterium]